MLKNYYELLGWDPDTGIPLPSTLESLGIGYINEELDKLR
jgi:aldehyde:ferredoxin oxidoreductase